MAYFHFLSTLEALHFRGGCQKKSGKPTLAPPPIFLQGHLHRHCHRLRHRHRLKHQYQRYRQQHQKVLIGI